MDPMDERFPPSSRAPHVYHKWDVFMQTAFVKPYLTYPQLLVSFTDVSAKSVNCSQGDSYWSNLLMLQLNDLNPRLQMVFAREAVPKKYSKDLHNLGVNMCKAPQCLPAHSWFLEPAASTLPAPISPSCNLQFYYLHPQWKSLEMLNNCIFSNTRMLVNELENHYQPVMKCDKILMKGRDAQNCCTSYIINCSFASTLSYLTSLSDSCTTVSTPPTAEHTGQKDSHNMLKNKGKGGKNCRCGKNENEDDKRDLVSYSLQINGNSKGIETHLSCCLT
ncbi:hypothetical protein BU15DRAFT_63921 [Melanogaster broomeanus]|nr:hypothetical protein BU15DRAFT_63921 [Melanogaster broomeanus]